MVQAVLAIAAYLPCERRRLEEALPFVGAHGLSWAGMIGQLRVLIPKLPPSGVAIH